MARHVDDYWYKMWEKLSGRYPTTVKVAAERYGNFGAEHRTLVRHYSELGRHYHTLNHIRHCFMEFSEVRRMLVDPEAVAMAIWYHDFVYKSKRGDNEEESAKAACKLMEKAQLPLEFILRVEKMILATKSHAGDFDNDTMLFLDIDMAILGQKPALFDAYDKQIECEYSWVPKQTYREERAKFLEGCLKGPIYKCPHFHAKYEAQARINLKRAVARLRAQKA
jgi:predicted metal-dependent HD superfamily phosphohydrolase